MLESFPVAVLVGTGLGFLAGLGIGGGSLLILWLTVILDLPYPEARGMNLLFFLPCAIIACFFRWKQGVIQWKSLFPAIVSGCIAAVVVNLIFKDWDLEIIRKLFGGLLLVTGFREVFYKAKQ